MLAADSAGASVLPRAGSVVHVNQFRHGGLWYSRGLHDSVHLCFVPPAAPLGMVVWVSNQPLAAVGSKFLFVCSAVLFCIGSTGCNLLKGKDFA